MTMKEMAFEIEKLQIEAEKVNSLQNTLRVALYQNDNAPETYEWAFVVLGELTFSLKNELNKLTKMMFNSLKGEKGATTKVVEETKKMQEVC